jgi:hypothetical protein
MAYSWVRNSVGGLTVGQRLSLLAGSIPVGGSLVRLIYGWSAFVQCPGYQYDDVHGRVIFFGPNTVRSGFGGTLPHPGSSPLGELDYPGERWLGYEHAPLVADGQVDWRDSRSHVNLRTEATHVMRECNTAVKNTYAGQTLGIYLAWESVALATYGIEFWVTGTMSALVSS